MATANKISAKEENSVLPPEIRIKIWEQMCLETRNITVSWQEIGDLLGLDYNEDNGPGGSCDDLVYRVANHPPVVLHINRESREEALKHYTLDLEVRHDWIDNPEYVHVPRNPIYINWKVDRICIIDIPHFATDNIGFIYDFMFLAQERRLRFIALNTACWKKDPENFLIQLISDPRYEGWFPVEEILLFHADSSFMYQEALEQKRAVVELPITSDRSTYQSLLGNVEYCDDSNNSRKAMWNFVDLLSAEIKLTRRFKEHEEFLARRQNHDEKAKENLASWIRPKIEWCTVKLRYLQENAVEKTGTITEVDENIEE